MARRTTKPYNDTDNPILYCVQSQSSWYKGTSPNTYVPVGILIHDTGCNNDMLKRYVQPSDNDPKKDYWLSLLGKGWGTDWNHKSVDAGLNYWIGRLQNQQVTTIGAGGTFNGTPSSNADNTCTRRAWGCASGSKGSCNGMKVYDPNTGKIVNGVWIQWEMCQDDKSDATYYKDCIDECVSLCIYLCKRYNINPLGSVKSVSGVTIPTIVNHWESYLLKLGSGHYDHFDWSDKFEGKTNHDNVFTDKIMVNVRQRIKDGISPTPVPPTPPTPPTPTPDYPDTPFLIKVKAPVDIYADSKGKKKTGKKVDKVGVYTIVECNEPDGFGKLKSGAGWVDLKKDENIYIRGEGGDEMKFSELKELYYRKGNIMKGDAVEIVQAAVNTPIDGSFGPNTEAAVKKFQKSKGIVADGIVGEETWRQIWNLCKKDQ